MGMRVPPPVFRRQPWHTCLSAAMAQGDTLIAPRDARLHEPPTGTAHGCGQGVPPHAWAILDAFLAISTECCPPCPTLTLRDLRNAKTAEP